MIIQLNNMKNYNSASINTFCTLTHKEYPVQNEEFLGKYIHLGYRDQSKNYIAKRLYIITVDHPEFNGENTEDDLFWRILRFDQVIEETDKGTAILMDKWGRVIVTDVHTIMDLCYYPFYTLSRNEVLLNICEDWEEFNKKYQLEPVFLYPIQDTDYLGRTVVTEYYRDIFELPPESNVLSEAPDQYKPWEVLKKQLLIGEPDYWRYPDCLLKSYPIYFPRHNHHYLDIPRRAVNSGILIRCDKGGSSESSSMVVAEFIDNTIRFVTDKEAYIFSDLSESVKVTDMSFIDRIY